MKKPLLKHVIYLTQLFTMAFTLQYLSMSLLLAWNGNDLVKSIEEVSVHLSLNEVKVEKAFKELEKVTEFKFVFSAREFRNSPLVSVESHGERLNDLLVSIASQSNLSFNQVGGNIHVKKLDRKTPIEMVVNLDVSVSGTVKDSNGEPIPGVTVSVPGTTIGTVTDLEGKYSITVAEDATLVFSFIGFESQRIAVGDQSIINVTLAEELSSLDEVVVVGYGTQRKSDLTGSVVNADLEVLADAPNTNFLEALKGTVPGLDIGQTVQSGEVPGMTIRGQTTLAGSNAPLVVVDGVIFRGSLNDINPSDIESIDILKDASAAAVYGSQATNGVILLTTSSGRGINGKPVISYSGSYSFNNPVRELPPPDAEGFYRQTEESMIFSSRTEESGYIEPNPDWEITNVFSVNEESEAYLDGRTTNWYSLLTNDFMYTQDHNLSMSNNTESTNYLVSLGYFEDTGYMQNERYDRLTGRINLDNSITDWLEIGLQSFMSISDYSGAQANTNDRYIEPYATDKDANGERYRTILAGVVNPFLQMERDDFDQSLYLFGNLYAKIDFPFLKGLSYKVNFANNYKRLRHYQYKSYAVDFQGEGEKEASFRYDWAVDNILSFNRRFNDIHNVQATFVYGVEQLQEDFIRGVGQNFVNGILGYHSLQVADSDRQQAISGAWDESTLYTMSRVFYGFKDKYLITGTLRRDGYSGFGKENKIGLFPSLALAWNVSEESFIMENVNWLSQLKLRASYGTVGNRTIGRYQTLAKVEGGYNFINMSGTPLYTQSITSLESPNLKWEKTTGVNFGIDFGIFSQRLIGSIEYYNNNTTDLFYRVDIPAISRYTEFPDNLGKLHNNGLEMSITSTNLKKPETEWVSTLNFSRNRNELRELLGFDLDGDGKEDDLISQGLFIGESIDAIFDYEINGKWQLGEEILPGFDVGAHKPVDQNGDGIIDPLNDKKIIGYSSPNYSLGINNTIRHKNWTLKFFIHSIQGGKNYYLGADNYLSFAIQNSEMNLRYIFPEGVDYWTPENPNGRYQRPGIYTASGTRGQLYGNRSFIRLQNVSFSYNLPGNLLNRAGLQNARIFINGINLLTLTKWNGWDPETNQTITRAGRPVMKSYTIGLNLEF
ncbi:MAG: TonB-dependent receptor [Cyclobacteriaceae bacterium]